MGEANRDFFFSYNTLDFEWVLAAKQALSRRAITTFVDREDLPKGLPWLSALESVLTDVRAVAVFVGPNGFGRWQMREVWLALDHQVTSLEKGRILPVIPIMLPGAERPASFLLLNTWVQAATKSVDDPVWDQLAEAISGKANGPKPQLQVCPYRGLSAFREIDAPFFFGREHLAHRIVDKVRSSGFSAIVGPSGSGKSSVVLAGAVPALRRLRPPSPTWEVVIFTPGNRPFHRLAAALVALVTSIQSDTDRLKESKKLGDALERGEVLLEDYLATFLNATAASERLLIVADQFEELFTMNSPPGSLNVPIGDTNLARRFTSCILEASRGKFTSVVITLRADFYSHALALSRSLSDAIEGGLVNVGQMTPDEVDLSINAPANLIGLTFEGGLGEELKEDVGCEPGNLPLLQFALAELWERRSESLLTQASYRAIGKVQGALATRASAVYRTLSDPEKRLTRDLFTRLVRLGSSEDGTEDSRQRAELREFSIDMREVIRRLADARLLVTSRDEATGLEIVEVVHEALIRRWDEVRVWLNEDREFLLWRQRLRFDLVQFKLARRDNGALLRGGVLSEARSWQARYGNRLTPAEADLIDASYREDRKRRLIARASLVLVAVTGIATVWWLTLQLRQETRLSDLQRLRLLEANADRLWPADSAHVTDLQVWLRSAEPLSLKLDQYKRELDDFSAQPEVQQLEKLKREQVTLRISIAREGRNTDSDSDLKKRLMAITESALPTQRKLEVLSGLVSGLSHLNDPDPARGLKANVRLRLDFAATIRAQSIDKESAVWTAAIESIADPGTCPLYRGLRIKPQEGLVPLQRNPSSGLWEFWHIQTGTRPSFGPDGKLFLNDLSGIVFVLMPGGIFHMGARHVPKDKSKMEPGEDPWSEKEEADEKGNPIQVSIKPFFMSKYELTQGQMVRTAYSNPSYYAPLKGSAIPISLLHPVEQISWEEAHDLMRKLGLLLPSEAQWEYCARGGTTTVWWTGNSVKSLRGAANLADAKYHSAGRPGDSEEWLNDGFEVHAPVGSFLPNAFGLYDVVGNVWEWCENTYQPYTSGAAQSLADYPDQTGEFRVLRGGGWGSAAVFSRSATRNHFKPEYRWYGLGLRPSRQLDE